MNVHIPPGPKELFNDLRSKQMLPAIIQGLIIGAMIVIIEISFANIIFSGELAPLATRASGLCVFGAGALCLTTGLFSVFPTLISLPQDTPVALLSITAAAIVSTIPTAAPETLFATVAATMVCSSLLTALFFWLIGKFKISNFARFLPFPVIGGFLAGSGVMLLIGSFGVMTDHSLHLNSLAAFLTIDMFIHWGPGVVFALGVFLLLRVKSHFFILPAALLAGVIAFFAIVFILDIPLAQIRQDGWLTAQIPTGQLWPAFTWATTEAINVPTLVSQLPNILTICLLSLIAMLLNINGIELGAHQDIDLDRELKVEALGNLVSGLGGGFSGYGTLSLSMLGPRSNNNSRIIPVTAALVCFCVIFLGGSALSFIPKPLLGGLLFLLGLFFVDEWIFTGWKRLTPSDYLIVLTIVLTIINQGFLQGVGLGLVLTIIIFLVRFTRIPVIQRSETLATRHSMQLRSVPDRVLLESTGNECIILTLSGYLFFGSTYFIGRKVKELFEQEQPLNTLLLDLTQIQGFDISAMNTLQRIAQQAKPKGIRLALASPPKELTNLIKRNSAAEAIQQLNIYKDIDEALEASEDHLLAQHRELLSNNSSGSNSARDTLFNAAVDDLDAKLQEQERFEEMLEHMEQYIVHKSVSDGDLLVEQGKIQQQVIFILWGNISLTSCDNAGRRKKLASIGSGKMIAPKAAWGPWSANYSANAEQQAMIATLPYDAIKQMEIDVPQVAMNMYKYMAQTFDKENKMIETMTRQEA
jgi:SulP family sulfate permease